GAVAGRAIGLERKDHARLYLDRFLEGIEPRDDRPFVDAETDAVREFEAERLHLAAEADFGGRRPAFGDVIRTYARLHQRNGVIDPVSRPFVGIFLRHRRLADAEGAVVAGTIADEAVHDVEEGLIARPDDAVGEIVRVRRAAFTRDGVDRLHAFRALRQEIVRCHGHHLAFAHAGLQLRRDLLVGA